jgi:hypothetical protein
MHPNNTWCKIPCCLDAHEPCLRWCESILASDDRDGIIPSRWLSYFNDCFPKRDSPMRSQDEMIWAYSVRSYECMYHRTTSSGSPSSSWSSRWNICAQAITLDVRYHAAWMPTNLRVVKPSLRDDRDGWFIPSSSCLSNVKDGFPKMDPPMRSQD